MRQFRDWQRAIESDRANERSYAGAGNAAVAARFAASAEKAQRVLDGWPLTGGHRVLADDPRVKALIASVYAD